MALDHIQRLVVLESQLSNRFAVICVLYIAVKDIHSSDFYLIP